MLRARIEVSMRYCWGNCFMVRILIAWCFFQLSHSHDIEKGKGTSQQDLDAMTGRGKWVKDNFLRMHTGLSRSDSTNDRRNSAHDCPTHHTDSYFWKSDKYEMERFQPHLLCKVMQGRPLAISGDTTSHTFFETIVNAMSHGVDMKSKKIKLSTTTKKTQHHHHLVTRRHLRQQKLYGIVFEEVCTRQGFFPFEMVMFDSPLLEFDGG